MKYSHRVFDGGLGGKTLYRLYDDALGLFVGGHLGLVHNVVYIGGGSSLGLVLETLDELLLGLFARQARDVLESLLSRAAQTVKLLATYFESLALSLYLAARLLDFVAGLGVFALLLIELRLTLLELGLLALHAREPLVGGLLGLGLDAGAPARGPRGVCLS